MESRVVGYLTIKGEVSKQDRVNIKYSELICDCKCGKKDIKVSKQSVLKGRVKSCGCLKKETNLKNGILLGKKRKAKYEGRNASLNHLERTYKRSAKLRKLSYALTSEEFLSLITSNCHYCGLPPTPYNTYYYSKTKNIKQYYAEQWSNAEDIEKHWINRNGIDRKDPTVGYVFENCVTACSQCNYGKRNSSYSEFVEYLERLVKHRTVKA